MARRKFALFGLVVAVGVLAGLALPRWRIITIVFEPGGATYAIENRDARRLPATMEIEDDGRLRLRVINRDSIPHAAGVLSVPPRDSMTVPADMCTGTDMTGRSTIVLR